MCQLHRTTLLLVVLSMVMVTSSRAQAPDNILAISASCFAVFEARKAHCVTPSQVVHNVHLHDCIEHCQQWRSCKAINYHTANRLCEVHNQAVNTAITKNSISIRHRRNSEDSLFKNKRLRAKTVYQRFSLTEADSAEYDLHSHAVLRRPGARPLPTPIEQHTENDAVRPITTRAQLQPSQLQQYYKRFQRLSPEKQESTWKGLLASNQLNAIDPDALREFANTAGFFLPDDFPRTTTTSTSTTTTTTAPSTSSPTTRIKLKINSFTTSAPKRDETDPWVKWLRARLDQKEKEESNQEMTRKRTSAPRTRSPTARTPSRPLAPSTRSSTNDILVMPASLSGPYGPPGVRPAIQLSAPSSATYRPATMPLQPLLPTLYPRSIPGPHLVSQKPKVTSKRQPATDRFSGFTVEHQIDQHIVMPWNRPSQPQLLYVPFDLRAASVQSAQALSERAAVMPQMPLNNLLGCQLHFAQQQLKAATSQQRVTRPSPPIPQTAPQKPQPPLLSADGQRLANAERNWQRSSCSTDGTSLIAATEWQYYVKQRGTNCPQTTQQSTNNQQRQVEQRNSNSNYDNSNVNELYAMLTTPQALTYSQQPSGYQQQQTQLPSNNQYQAVATTQQSNYNNNNNSYQPQPRTENLGGTYLVQPQPIVPWLISHNSGTPTARRR